MRLIGGLCVGVGFLAFLSAAHLQYLLPQLIEPAFLAA
jgi:hypothetical protein